MGKSAFFAEQKEQSKVKAAIVQKYFFAWSRVMFPKVRQHAKKVAYIDLFSGPGRYEDATVSTPILVLTKAIENEDMREMLVTIFNDKDANHSQSLQRTIDSLPNVTSLRHKPSVMNVEVGVELVAHLENIALVPSLFFVDPWGYKGLSLRLIESVVKDWGSECIFFFNYNRVNMGLTNPFVRPHINALFGEEEAEALISRVDGLESAERELEVVEALAQSLKKGRSNYVLPFRFRDNRGTRTSHYLIFVTKHVLGYTIMKEVMASEGDGVDGVPSFEYVPATARQPLLFELSKPLEDLADQLLVDFAGRSVTMVEVFREHHVGKRYVKKNYKDALSQLEHQQSIVASPSAADRPKRKGKPTFADKVLVTFTNA